MEQLHWLVVNNSLTVTMPSGEPKSVNKSENQALFSEIMSAIVEERWEDVISALSPKEKLVSFSEGNIDVVGGLIHINGKSVPPALNERILEYARHEPPLPYQSLIRFWENLNENPSNRAVTKLYGFLEANKHPITPDGHFIGYRGVNDDFMDCRTNTIDNSPGVVVTMPRNEVDESDTPCSYGLHVANFSFARSFGSKTVIVKVNPRDVVSIPSSYGVEKMRVCRYEVIQVVDIGSVEPLFDDSSDDEDYDDYDFEYSSDQNDVWSDFSDEQMENDIDDTKDKTTTEEHLSALLEKYRDVDVYDELIDSYDRQDILYNICIHKNTTVDMIKSLVFDEDPEVRDFVIGELKGRGVTL